MQLQVVKMPLELDNIGLTALEIQIASSRTNAEAQIPITIKGYAGVQLRIESRVSDKKAW